MVQAAIEEGKEEEPKSFLSQLLGQLPRLILTYLAVSFLTQSFKTNFSAPGPEPNTGIERSISNTYLPSWKLGAEMDLYFYLDSEKVFKDFDDKSKLVVEEKGIRYGDFKDDYLHEFDIPCTSKLKNNGSLYGHFYLTKDGIAPGNDRPDESSMIYHQKLLTRFMPQRKIVNKKNLFDDDLGEIIQQKELPIISYWWQNISLSIVPSESPLSIQNQPQIQKMIKLDSNHNFLPIFYTNDFWMLHENLAPINNTVESLHISFTFSPQQYWKFAMLSQFQESFKIQTEVMGANPEEPDQIKRMFIDTNPYLLAITMCVSLLHSVFDFLAFKNDIKFWKNRKNMEGLSFRYIVLNIIFQLIIFLYLMDNDTSYMIIVSTGMGLLIEIWKINKTVIVKRKDTFPYLDFIDRVKPSKLAAKTQKYDKMAFGYLSYALFPLMVLYTVYSVMYEKHKSWYSFILGTLVGFVYTFGFISMTPQLL
jgi:hypothetical protein